ncbi:MAG TPA: transketolase, partial [Candidatus Polarisedimenticolia bacterium]|nr:transketolase [Candidatus Polarisedimenticolia bacterium]
MKPSGDLDRLCINTVRTLAMDAVEKANSGHPGLPMGAAAMAYVLWTRFLRHNPANPAWPARDRFVLSAGHGSMLLYALLHLTGYPLSLEEIRRFRQWESRTPGHPEYGLTPGVETTTGPLGQGFGNGVGMALAQRYLAGLFNRPGHPLLEYRIYGIVSDGDLMEGVASEAASLAGHLKLGNLVYLYDQNHICLDGPTDRCFTEDVEERFRAYGWHARSVDGNDLEAVASALEDAEGETLRPSLILARTHIGHGSPHKQDTADAHGAPLGAQEVRLTKKALGWPEDAVFWVPPEALAVFRGSLEKGKRLEEEWERRHRAYREAYPREAGELERIWRGELPEGWDADLPVFASDTAPPLATREASGKIITSLSPRILELLGGSADLGHSTQTYLKGCPEFSPSEYAGRSVRFGVREHAMGSILNGMALSGLIPYGGTFLMFSDYMRPSIRLAALMRIRVIYILTHDSIGLGEDGPTHQPVETLAALRAIPNLTIIRPADATETVAAWKWAIQHRGGPVALALSRQKLPVLDRNVLAPAESLVRGAYVLSEARGGIPLLILMASGSEVSLILETQKMLEEGESPVPTRVVSFPSWELFEAQSTDYRDLVLPPGLAARFAVEAAVRQGWDRYVGPRGGFWG